MNTTTNATETFNRLTRDDRWLGFGYLGARANALDSSDPELPARPDLVAAVDQMVLEYASAKGWTEAQMFAWANSRTGRFFADTMLAGFGSIEERFAKARRWRLLDVPPDACICPLEECLMTGCAPCAGNVVWLECKAGV